MLTIEDIARICHEAIMGIQESQGICSCLSWAFAPPELQDSTIHSVEFILENNPNPERIHNEWVEYKKRKGWRHGPRKNSDEKTHPCLVPHNKLPWGEKIKDYVFLAIVNACKHINAAGDG